MFTCGGGNNSAQYCKAAAEPDQDKQVAIYNEAQTLLIDDAAFLPLLFPVATYELNHMFPG